MMAKILDFLFLFNINLTKKMLGNYTLNISNHMRVNLLHGPTKKLEILLVNFNLLLSGQIDLIQGNK